MCSLNDQLLVQVKDAITILANPSNPEIAKNAIEWLQLLKSDTSNSEVNIQLAFQLIISPNGNDVSNVHSRLFGLQLLDSIIGHSWNSVSPAAKEIVKSQLIDLVLINDLHHNIHLNALVKCVVNTMIRDWPQHWPGLTRKLLGTQSNRTVLLVIWRLAEDVGVLMNPSNPDRRRELMAALDDSMSDIFDYIGQSVQSPDMVVALTALKALTGILEWTAADESLCDFLCNILAQESLTEESIEAKMFALECISLILNRKHRNISEKRIILTFFKESNFSKLMSALKILLAKTVNPPSESCFSLLSLAKSISSVFNSSGQQLLNLGATEVPNKIFEDYIDQMILIFEHPNPIIHSIPINFFKEASKKKFIGGQITLKLFQSIPVKLVKRSEDDIFVHYEFDTFQDYEQIFYKIRAEVLDLLRILTTSESEIMFKVSSQLLESFLDGHDDRWEPLTLILDAVMNKIPEPENYKIQSRKILSERLLRSSCQDAIILSFQLSCISAFLVFMINEPPQHFEPILSHVFNLLRFPFQTKNSEDVKNIRRHATSFFVKLCKMYPEALMPHFNDIRFQVSQWIEKGEISRMEGCTLNEGLVLVSNCIKDEADRQDFITKLIESFGTFLQFNMNSNEFAQFIGLSSQEEYIESGSNRSIFTSLVSTFLSILKRSNHAEGMYNMILPFLPPFVSLAKCLNDLWRLQVKSWDPVIIFAKIASPDKGCLLEGFCLPRMENDVKSEALKCQSYLWALHESLFSLLSSLLLTFGSSILVKCDQFISIFQDSQFMPPMKLRMIFKVILKPVSLRWPDDSEFRQYFFLPIMENFIPCIFQQSDSAWASFRNTDWREYEQIEDEIVEEQTNRLLSRELLDVMKVILFQEKRKAECDEMTDSSSGAALQKPSISELGKFLLNRNLNKIVCMSVSTLSWIDSNILFKSVVINQVILEFLIENQLIQSKEEISFYIHHLLTGLSFMSGDEQNQPAFLTLFLTLYTHSKSVNNENLFWNASVIDPTQWQVLDLTLKKLDEGKKTAGTERKKREALKTVLSPVIGANLNQVKPEKLCEIRSLEPHIFRSRKVRKESSIDLQGSELCALFAE